jgi:hypothetical protein
MAIKLLIYSHNKLKGQTRYRYNRCRFILKEAFADNKTV